MPRKIPTHPTSGLTDDDFAPAPERRYGLTELDNMDNDWAGASLGYTIELTDALDWNVTGYYNEFERDWFKVDRIGGTKLADIIAAANDGDATAIAQLHGKRRHAAGHQAQCPRVHVSRCADSAGLEPGDWQYRARSAVRRPLAPR